MNLTAIIIVSVITFGIVEIIRTLRKHNPAPKQVAGTDPKILDELAKLKERVNVLEKIVTDDSYELKKQFDNLKD